MRTTVKNYLPAIACAATLLVCYFVIRPYAEIGLIDDWSYVKAAQKLAETGHITYGGAETPMLGWQLYFGALLIKLFGFSFTAVRFSTVIEAMAMAFLLERTCVRAGLNTWNATLATLTFVLSPLFFPLAFTFMTDVSGVLCVVLCLYMCLRAIEAKSERAAMVWISLAALANAVDGTARQNAWLAVLVMVPSTLWLLRRWRRVLVAGCISWVVAVGIVVAATRWFARQPYTVSVSPIPDTIDLKSLKILLRISLDSFGELMLLALPVLLMFTGVFRSWNRRMAKVFAAGLLCFVVPGAILLHAWRQHWWIAGFADGYMINSTFDRLRSDAAQEIHFAMVRQGLRVSLTVAILLSILSLFAVFFADAQRRPVASPVATTISWRELWIVTGPFSAANIVLLALLIQGFGFSDRYLLPLLVMLLIVLTRAYQDSVNAKLPLACMLLIALFGAFSAAATHDEFALYRGYAAVANEIESHGVPATAILGPWEFEGWTQMENAGHINDDRMRIPVGAYVPEPPRVYPANCDPDLFYFLDETPVIKPAYAISRDPGACGGQVAFPPVTYRTWVAPQTNRIFAVRLPPPFPD